MNLNDENARIVLLGCIMTMYVLFGAVVIRSFESPFEKNLLNDYRDMYNQFEERLSNGTAKIEELRALLYTYGNVTSALGELGKYERWNFLGSLHFVVTIVTTIGECQFFSSFYNLCWCTARIEWPNFKTFVRISRSRLRFVHTQHERG